MNTELDQLPNESLIRILELTQKLLAPFELSQILEEVRQAGLEVTQADTGSIWLFDKNSNKLAMHLPAIEPPILVEAGQGLVGECFSRNEVINVEDCYADPRFNPAVDTETGYRSDTILSVPLVGFEGSHVGVIQLVNKASGPFTQQDELLAIALAAQSAVALQRALMIDTLISKERLDEELAIAKTIQLATLPDKMPELEDYEFSGGFVPADSTGGDLFDLVTLDDEVFILMGDATGHGFGAALSATQMQAMFRVAFRVGASLDEAYIHVNNQLVEDLPDNKFLTAFVGFLNKHTHTVRYHSGGQGPLLHYHADDQSCDWHPPTSFPLGVMELETIDPPHEIKLAPGDIFAVISDGVYEYNNENGEQFGEERVAKIFRDFNGTSMKNLQDRLLEAVYEFGGNAEQLDDITIVLTQRKAEREARETTTLMCSREIGELERIVNVTKAFFAEYVIDASIRNTVDLAIEELFVNMVKYNTETRAKIKIEMEAQQSGIKVSLTDYDVERFDPTVHGNVDVSAPLEDRVPGGLGVFLTLKLVDSIDYEYQDRVSKITFIKRAETK